MTRALVEIDDRAGLGPSAYRERLRQLNDGDRELVICPVRPGAATRRTVDDMRRLNLPVVLVATSDTESWDRLAWPYFEPLP
jgi:hypothetical protein